MKGYDFVDMTVLGWLGPIGVTSLFYIFYTKEQYDSEFLWATVSAVIFGSTLVHGVTASITARWYKRQKFSTDGTEQREDEDLL